ncbi:hypothetical protein ACU614_24295, partial [Klebsiella aerogenes]
PAIHIVNLRYACASDIGLSRGPGSGIWRLFTGGRPPWTRGNNCPPVENLNKSGGDLPDIKTMDEKELQEYFY